LPPLPAPADNAAMSKQPFQFSLRRLFVATTLTTNIYNLNDERISTSNALGNATTTMHDAVGNILSVTSPAPQPATGTPNSPVPNPQTWFIYDTMNRKTAEIDPLPTQSPASNLQPPPLTWFYDLNGNVTSTVDALGHTTSIAYNGWNLPVSVTDALGGMVTTAFDAWGRCGSEAWNITTFDLLSLGNAVG
jgi:YD repeat-containing protein